MIATVQQDSNGKWQIVVGWSPYRMYSEERYDTEEEAQLIADLLTTCWELEAWKMLSEHVRDAAVKATKKYCDMYLAQKEEKEAEE